MYETEYNIRRGTLTVRGDHYEIEQALDYVRFIETRKLFRSRTLPWRGLRHTENRGPPVNVSIRCRGDSVRGHYEMTVSPFLNLRSHLRVLSLVDVLEEHLEAGRTRITQTQLR